MQALLDLTPIAYDHNRQSLGVNQLAGRVGYFLGRHCRDSRNRSLKVVVRKFEFDEIFNPTGNFARGLESRRVTSSERGFRKVELLGGNCSLRPRDRAKLLKDLYQCRGGHSRLNAGRRNIRPRLLSPLETRPRAIRVPLVLTQVHIEPARELSTKNGVHDDQWKVPW